MGSPIRVRRTAASQNRRARSWPAIPDKQALQTTHLQDGQAVIQLHIVGQRQVGVLG